MRFKTFLVLAVSICSATGIGNAIDTGRVALGAACLVAYSAAWPAYLYLMSKETRV